MLHENCEESIRVNIGCGLSPTDGWLNFDNSFAVRLANWPRVVRFLAAGRILTINQAAFAARARHLGIRWADAIHLPLADASVFVVYSSHMLEHLDRYSAGVFLAEAFRVLAPGGFLRIVVPDLNKLICTYLTDQDADKFVAASLMGNDHRPTLFERIREVVFGNRRHSWMYDYMSLIRLVTSVGFSAATQVPPGMTSIPDPGCLDLAERVSESIYIEAIRP